MARNRVYAGIETVTEFRVLKRVSGYVGTRSVP